MLKYPLKHPDNGKGGFRAAGDGTKDHPEAY